MRCVRSWYVATIVGFVGWSLCPGCGGAIRPDFDSAEPAARNAAIVQAARTNNRAAVPDLVRMLDSDDPATRLLAISALERLTGHRRGYDPTESQASRDEAVSRWRRSLREGGVNAP